MQPSILSKFIKFRGRVQTATARKLADRVRTYLRSLDQAGPKLAHDTQVVEAQEIKEPLPSAAEQVAAAEWRVIANTSSMQLQIARLATLLEAIITQVARSNSGVDERVLSELERRQLIAVLETALAVLKAPMVEKGLLSKAQELLNKTATRATEKQIELGLGNASGEAAKALWEFIKMLF